MEFVNALGALTGNMAVQQVRAGLKAIYLSGWQVAGDATSPVTHTPTRACTRPTRCRRWCVASTTRCCAPTRSPRWKATPQSRNWLAPIVADGEAGFGGALNVYELQKAMIAAGVAGSHWEDQPGLGEEVRPPRWQGAHPDPAAHPHSDLGAVGV